ncbi:matrixin family metalloprotease [Secundilactobacillus malefermentans]|uniref:Peptidase M10 metallopeptidase domain-containing protein n=1 Tax=Secundilactobacillus malefermentans TaxID=176292 RepID=A0A4V3A3M1_9LACO|nr:matrixin family metalloprotease [Secundilactobacillus malefermentans]KRM58756.1 hypothetical protein FD44_GL000378 [Secundilactobacillus malefermentans DSM 5705 = KCTC 3548]TDG75088.1 hypothetical protein C5L31_001718 [Secundilactobacillus malefermentans]
MTHKKLILHVSLATLSGLMIFAPVATIPAQASSVKPSSAMLKKSNSYYKKHYKAIAKKYKFTYSAQTGLNKSGTIYVYEKTKSSYLKKSLSLAMNYWNSKLGRQAIKVGSKKYHTVTFSVSNAKASKSDDSDAWWIPSTKKVQIRNSLYADDLSVITNTTLYNSEKSLVKTANANLAAYKAGLSTTDPDYQSKLDTYQQQQVDYAKAAFDNQESNLKSGLAIKAREFEYANTLAHEFGHVMGLKHSPNKSDLMYWASGTNDIYNYNKVKNSSKGFSLVTSTDVARAKLAVKVHNARN